MLVLFTYERSTLIPIAVIYTGNYPTFEYIFKI